MAEIVSLASLGVNFVMQGADTLTRTLDTIRGQLNTIHAASDAVASSRPLAAIRADMAALAPRLAVVQARFDAASRAAAGLGNQTSAQMTRALAAVQRLGQQLNFLRARQAALGNELRRATPATVWERAGMALAGLRTVATGAFEIIQRGAQTAFTALTQTTYGFVMAGFQGTTHMGALQAQMQRLGWGIAGVFVPWMEKAIELVQKAADWFMNLTGEQQANIRAWVAHTLKMAALVRLLPLAVRGIIAVARVTRALTMVTLGATAATGNIVGALAGLALAAGLWAGAEALMETGLDTLTDKLGEMANAAAGAKKELRQLTDEELKEFVKKDFEKHAGFLGTHKDAIKDYLAAVKAGKDEQRRRMFAQKVGEQDRPNRVMPQVGGPEAIRSTIARLQQAAFKVDYAKETADNTKEMSEGLKKFIAMLEKQGTSEKEAIFRWRGMMGPTAN